MKLSKNNIIYPILGFVGAFIISVIGQFIECNSINLAKSVSVCSNGERVNYVWSIFSYLLMASGFAVWIYLNMDTAETEE